MFQSLISLANTIDEFDNLLLKSYSKNFNFWKKEDGKYVMSIDLPGYASKDVKVTEKDGFIKINANNEERGETSFKFSLPVNECNVDAKFNLCVLKLIVSVKEQKENEILIV